VSEKRRRNPRKIIVIIVFAASKLHLRNVSPSGGGEFVGHKTLSFEFISNPKLFNELSLFAGT
jgi:hypothetical protein